jgi:four helix bundle protein
VEQRGAAVKSYRDLIAWQKAMELVGAVYQLTRQLPKEEQFGLTSQLRRAAVSVPSNIAEGQSRFSKPDFSRFLMMARGSISEIETQLLICVQLAYLKPESIESVLQVATECGKIVNGLRDSLKADAAHN